MLLPLWSRAKVSKDYSSLFNNMKSIELVEKIDYDFSTLEENPFQNLFMAARAKQFDYKIRSFITEHPRASVINSERGLTQRFTELIMGWFSCMTSTFRMLSPSENNCSLRPTR